MKVKWCVIAWLPVGWWIGMEWSKLASFLLKIGGPDDDGCHWYLWVMRDGVVVLYVALIPSPLAKTRRKYNYEK